MKIVLEFDVNQSRKFKPSDLEDEMAGAMSAFEEFEGAAVSCELIVDYRTRKGLLQKNLTADELRMRDACWRDVLVVLRNAHSDTDSGVSGKQALASIYDALQHNGPTGFGYVSKDDDAEVREQAESARAQMASGK